jgi:hypothetical protein
LPTTLSGFGITDAYTKTQVDNSLALKLNLSGGTMSGAIAMGGSKITGLGAPTTDFDAVTLKYVSDLYGSTASAASSAAAALVSQNAAAASASAASTSEGNALTYKNAAAASASAASTSETNAAGSAASAAASYDSFDDRYLGPKSTAPAVDNDGNPLLVGALYFDTTINSMRVYDGSLWMSAGSSVNGTSRRYRYIATAGQTTFTGVDSNGATLAYDPLYLDVYLNGLRLDQSDYTATSGSSIVLGVAASVNDEVNIICFGTFAVATHVLKTGDTMTGQLTLPNLSFSGTGGRITGDFSNATVANRALLQTSTTNGGTFITALPNGTGTASGLFAYNNSDPANSSHLWAWVNGTTDVQIRSGVSGTGTYLPMTFYTGGSERIRVDTSGNVGIGTSSPNRPLEIKATNIGLRLNNTAAGGNAGMEILPSASGKSWLVGASYNVSNAFEITPSTTNGGTTYTTPSMVIDSSGNLLVGTTSGGNGRIEVYGVPNSLPAIKTFQNATTSQQAIAFGNPNGVVGSITTSGSATAFNTSSDYRLKENITPMTGALASVSQLKPVTYTWKVDGVASQGFIAHELQEVVPDCVTGEKDAVDENGNPVYQGIDTSFLVATLTAAIQELKAINDSQAQSITSLTNRITALEQA